MRHITFTIANGQSLSAAIILNGWVPVRIHTPAAITGTVFTFQTAIGGSGGTFNNLFDGVGAGAEYVVGMGTSRAISLISEDFRGVSVLKVRTGTSGSPSAQGAERTFTLVCVPGDRL